MKQGKRLVPRSPILMVAAVSLLGFVVAWKYIPDLGVAMNRLMWSLGKMGAPFHIVSHDKTYLAVPRLIHALSLLYVLSCLPVVTRTAASSLASPLRLMGRQGLAVFAGGTVMALSAQVLLRGFGIDTWLAWALPPMGIAAMIVLAWISENGLSLGTAPGNTKFARVTAPKRGA